MLDVSNADCQGYYNTGWFNPEIRSRTMFWFCVVDFKLLTTELQKVLYLLIFYCKNWSQLYYLVEMNLFNVIGLNTRTTKIPASKVKIVSWTNLYYTKLGRLPKIKKAGAVLENMQKFLKYKDQGHGLYYVRLT